MLRVDSLYASDKMAVCLVAMSSRAGRLRH
ncbi:Uncharacterised protein [Mycobacteroides abscessus subsp. abscessus]|nr:Uncharacterised protein [Mycobacteroides abscessus subsp. abscessus]